MPCKSIHFFTSAQIQISGLDFGGSKRPAILLHGLFGGAHEWTKSAEWLQENYRVIALDQRGHGQSAKELDDFSIEAFTRDAADVLLQLSDRPALVIGQSMGGVVAMLLAAMRPELVQRLVVVEATAWSDSKTEGDGDWLSQWPLPFKTISDAKSFFHAQGLDPEIWVQVLHRTPDGFAPVFYGNDMRAIAVQLAHYDYRAACRSILAPTLVIAGRQSWLDGARVREVADLIPNAVFLDIEAGHDVHLDAPEAFKAAVTSFISS